MGGMNLFQTLIPVSFDTWLKNMVEKWLSYDPTRFLVYYFVDRAHFRISPAAIVTGVLEVK